MAKKVKPKKQSNSKKSKLKRLKKKKRDFENNQMGFITS